MNRLNLSWMFLALIVFITGVTGQDAEEILTGGNMEDASAWTVYHLNSDVDVEYEFNYTKDTPSEGAGGCLWIYGVTENEINILFWQQVTLIAGETYEISGVFKDLTGGLLSQFWCDVDLSPETPVEGKNYRPANDSNSDIRISMNTWAGCGPNLDGTFQDDGCSGTGATYTVPDSFGVGEAVTYYFGVKPGVWAGGPAYEFEILIDEMSLIGPAATRVENNQTGLADHFTLHYNYPNPFNPETRIVYTLNQRDNVRLSVVDLKGREVAVLEHGRKDAGTHSVIFSGVDLPSGVYFYKLHTSHGVMTQKMALVK